jgi:hypothetical protein
MDSSIKCTTRHLDSRVKHCAYGHRVATLLNPRGITTVSHKYSPTVARHTTVVVAVPSTVHYTSFLWHYSPASSSVLRFLHHTHTHTQSDTQQDSSGRVISPSQRPLPTQDNTTYKHKRQTSMSRAVFEPAIPATKWPQTYVVDRAATGIGRTLSR